MTTPPDPFGGRPFGQVPGGPPILTSVPARPAATNVLATLSVVFAFVFAPIGAVLGHVGLAQIKHTGQPGRSRAVIGLATSYAIIAITIVAVTIWTITASTEHRSIPPRAASPSGPATPSAAAVGPHVSPSELGTLLPNALQMSALTNDFHLSLHGTVSQLEVGHREGVVDRAECEGLLVVGDARVYDTNAVRGMYLTDYLDTSGGFALEAVQAVSAYDDAAAAQAALNTLLAGWRACGGDRFTLNFNGKVLQQNASVPTDDGHGLTTATVITTNAPLFTSRAIAAKANVIVDVMISTKTQTAAVSAGIANSILDKIPS